MSNETQLIVKTAIGIIGGLLIAAGVLPAGSKDAFTIDVSTVAGYVITILSTGYLLEHAMVKVKDDLQYTTEETTTTEPTTPAAPVQPTA